MHVSESGIIAGIHIHVCVNVLNIIWCNMSERLVGEEDLSVSIRHEASTISVNCVTNMTAGSETTNANKTRGDKQTRKPAQLKL